MQHVLGSSDSNSDTRPLSHTISHSLPTATSFCNQQVNVNPPQQRRPNAYVQGDVKDMTNSLMFPSGQIETYGGDWFPFLRNLRLNLPRRRLGGLRGWSRDGRWLWRGDLVWWYSWLRRAGVVCVGCD